MPVVGHMTCGCWLRLEIAPAQILSYALNTPAAYQKLRAVFLNGTKMPERLE